MKRHTDTASERVWAASCTVNLLGAAPRADERQALEQTLPLHLSPALLPRAVPPLKTTPARRPPTVREGIK